MRKWRACHPRSTCSTWNNLRSQGWTRSDASCGCAAGRWPPESALPSVDRRRGSMLGIADYGAFCAAILLFLMLPGPGTFALLTSTGKGGFRAGAAATAGIIIGDQVLLWLAVDGVAALLAAHP